MTRNHLIGGTDAATLVGLGRISPLVLYLRLRGELADDFAGNEATEAGTLFEDHVAVPMVRQRLGIELVRPSQRVLCLPGEPRIGCSLDFDVAGKREVAEIKLTGSRAMWGEPGEKVPVHVGAQVQFQSAVARAAGRAVPCVHVIAMFVPGFTMEPFPVEEDREVGEALIHAAKDMLRRVDKGEPPTPGDEADARALFLGKRGETLVLSLEEVALMRQLREAKAAVKIAEQQEQQIRDALLPRLGNATEFVHPTTGEVLATWRPNRMFDEASFTASHPEIAVRFQRFDRTLAGKDPLTKKLINEFMREPMSAAEATRPFNLKGE